MRRMRRQTRSLTTLITLISLSCRTPGAPIATTPTQPIRIDPPAPLARASVPLDPKATEHGKLTIAFANAGEAPPKLDVTALGESDLARLFAQLEPLPAQIAPAPAMRAPSAAPAPSAPVTPIALAVATGKQIADAPPAPIPNAPAINTSQAPDPLTPPELLPTGQVSDASEVYVRFGEPMVPVADVGVARQAPATIAPSVPGSWRWVDTRIARFSSTGEFPKATDYTITVPAGTRALSGAVLAKPATATFSTPPITLERVGMHRGRPDAALPISFDQPFDAAITSHLRVEHKGKPVAYEVITLEQAKERWARDPRIRHADIRLSTHTMLIAPKDAWPGDLRVTLAKGAPSREGPRVSMQPISHDIPIIGPFTLKGIECGGKPAFAGNACPANRFFDVRFSNFVGRHDPSAIRIVGEPADKTKGTDSNARLLAPSPVGKTYTVEVAEDLRDEAGQQLVGPRTAKFTTKQQTHDAYLAAPTGMYVLDPRYEIPQWKVEVAAIASVRIQLYRVEPKDYFKWQKLEETRKGPPPGKLAYDKVHPIGPRSGAIARVDLRPALTDGVGHVVAIATPTPIAGRTNSYLGLHTAWIQVTKLGVTARFDGERVHAWVQQIDPLRLLEPRAGVITSLLADGTPAVATTPTDADGHAMLEFPAPAPRKPVAPDEEMPDDKPVHAILLASAGGDSTFEAIDRRERTLRRQTTRWYITDDRFTYKPGETVYVKGWIRRSHTGVNPDIELPAPGETVAYTLLDSKNAKLGSGTTTLTPQGGFDLELAIPSTANLGTAQFSFETGTHAVGIAATPDGEPALLQVDATVVDIDRASIRESSRPIVVHPSAYYVGIQSVSETSEELELVVTDIDGGVVDNVPIEIVVEGVEGVRASDDHPKIVDTQRFQLTSKRAPVRLAWKRRDADTAYSVIAKIRDGRGRGNATRFFVPWWKRERQSTDFDVLADKPLYKPGDVAKLEITSAIVPAIAIVSFARQGVVSQRKLQLTQKTTILEVPIEPSFIRNVHVIVDRISRITEAVPLPERVSREIELRLEPEHGRLQVTTKPTKPTVGPGDQATFEVSVQHRGKPVAGAEVALMAVDEAVLAVSEKVHADPLSPFYFDVDDGTKVLSSLAQITDAGEDLLFGPGFRKIDLDGPEGEGFGYGSGRGGMRGRTSAVPSVSIGSPGSRQARKDFRATAVWAPKLLTDASGRARVTVKMPESLTRFRIVALATSSTRYFGKAEGTIATQRPLNVRATAPRFLSQGDRFSLPVVVQNLDGKPRTVEVGVRAANLIGGPSGKRVTIPAGQRAELRFDFRTQTRGRAVIQTIAVSNDLADASQIDLPVYEPVTTEAFATYGVVDDKPGFEQLAVPQDIVADVGGVEAELFASQLSSLSDAFWYLQVYPYECAEQRSSRMLATAALGDVLEAFAAPNRPTKPELDAQRARDIRELERDQKGDGWGYFYRNEPDPFVTQQVVGALVAQGAKGAPIERGAVRVAKSNAARIASLEALAAKPATARGDLSKLPSEIGLAAAELSTLATLASRADLRKALAAEKAKPASALRLHHAATKLGVYPIDAKAQVLALVAKHPAAAAARRELVTQLLAAAREDAATATITAQYTSDERLLLVSKAKTTALVLGALIREVPDHTLIPKLARGLLDGRKRGRWGSTQENLAVLQSMRRYFDSYEKTAPDFTGKLWLGAAGYAEHGFQKRDARAAVRVGWPALTGAAHTLSLAKSGPGRMYYRVGIQYAPAKLDLPPVDAGFVVRRSYAGIDDPRDVLRTPEGHYKIKLGALVRIELEVITTAKRHAVALVDPLPAGFEPINTRLATAERTTDSTADWDHVNLRDNRSEAFDMEMPEGRRRFVYTVRANTPGTFAAAPAKAEEMYAPETFGRTSGTLVTIE
jgi:uncharacterized protein YfaS (alpha-2-macroglobulin family)